MTFNSSGSWVGVQIENSFHYAAFICYLHELIVIFTHLSYFSFSLIFMFFVQIAASFLFFNRLSNLLKYTSKLYFSPPRVLPYPIASLGLLFKLSLPHCGYKNVRPFELTSHHKHIHLYNSQLRVSTSPKTFSDSWITTLKGEKRECTQDPCKRRCEELHL